MVPMSGPRWGEAGVVGKRDARRNAATAGAATVVGGGLTYLAADTVAEGAKRDAALYWQTPAKPERVAGSLRRAKRWRGVSRAGLAAMLVGGATVAAATPGKGSRRFGLTTADERKEARRYVYGKADRTQDRLFTAGLASGAVGAGGVALNRHAARVIAEAPAKDAARVAEWGVKVKGATAERKRHARNAAAAHGKAADAQRELGIINTATAGRSGLSSVVIKPHGAKAPKEYPLNDPVVHERVRYLEREKIPALARDYEGARRWETNAAKTQAEARAGMREAKRNPAAPKVAAKWKPRGRLGTGLAVAGGLGAAGSAVAIERRRGRQAPTGNAVGRRPGSGAQARAERVAQAAAEGERYRELSR